MSLTGHDFDRMAEDFARWEREGLSVLEARGCLSMWGTTVYPIAQNAARFIEEHWPESQIARLAEPYATQYQEARRERD